MARSYDARPPAIDIMTSVCRQPIRRYKNLTQTTSFDGMSQRYGCKIFYPTGIPVIAPQVQAGKSVIIAAHGNSFKRLVKYLDNISDEDILNCNIPTVFP